MDERSSLSASLSSSSSIFVQTLSFLSLLKCCCHALCNLLEEYKPLPQPMSASFFFEITKEERLKGYPSTTAALYSQSMPTVCRPSNHPAQACLSYPLNIFLRHQCHRRSFCARDAHHWNKVRILFVKLKCNFLIYWFFIADRFLFIFLLTLNPRLQFRRNSLNLN